MAAVDEYLFDRAAKIAAEVDLPWAELDGKTVLVTGSTGLIGSQVVRICSLETITLMPASTWFCPFEIIKKRRLCLATEVTFLFWNGRLAMSLWVPSTWIM